MAVLNTNRSELNDIIQKELFKMMNSPGYQTNFKKNKGLNNIPNPNKDVILILSTGHKIKGFFDWFSYKYKARRISKNETKFSLHNLDIHDFVVGWEEIKEENNVK